ncbi:MAG: hypothetical protein ABH837_03625 [bacterium]
MKELLNEEFQLAFSSDNLLSSSILPEAIIVLSGEYPEENRERVCLALELARASNRSKTRIFLVEAAEKLGDFWQIAMNEMKLQKHRTISLIDCGPAKMANTKTQFLSLISQNWIGTVESWKYIVIITSDYHVPRVARAASRFLPKDTDFQVFGAHWQHPDHSQEQLQKIETEKIIRYIKSGDIAKIRRDLQS